MFYIPLPLLYLPCPSLYDLVIRLFLHFLRKKRKKIQAETAKIESNGAAPDDLDNDEEDASTCKSILHRFGYNNETARNPHKKNLRYADGVLPGSGSPDDYSTAMQEMSQPPTHSVGNR